MKSEFLKAPGVADFLMMLGKCITDWAMIEEEMFHICRDVLAVTLEQCAIIYYRTPTLDSRLALAEELVGDAFGATQLASGDHPPAEFKAWKTLLADIRAEAQIRNRLAHHPVGMAVFADMDEKGRIQSDLKFKPESFPAHTEWVRKKSSGTAPLTLEDLELYEPKITALYLRVEAFRAGPLKGRLAARLPPVFPSTLGPK